MKKADTFVRSGLTFDEFTTLSKSEVDAVVTAREKYELEKIVHLALCLQDPAYLIDLVEEIGMDKDVKRKAILTTFVAKKVMELSGKK